MSTSFGEWLRKKRIEQSLTQQALANQLGITLKTIQRFESSATRPSPYTIRRLEQVLGPLPEGILQALPDEEANQSPAETLAVATDQIAEADPKNIQEVASVTQAIINTYYQDGLSQSRQSFRWSLICSGIALLFLIGAITVLLFRQPAEIAIASGIGGAIVEAFAGTLLYLYRKASDQLATYRMGLESTQQLLLANSMCEQLEGDVKHQARIELVQLMGRSAVEMRLLSVSSEKAIQTLNTLSPKEGTDK